MGSEPFALILTGPNGKGPAFAGALFVCGLVAGRTGAEDRAYHDTYYVVAHGDFLLSVAVGTLAVLAAWWAIFRLSPAPPRRLRTIVLLTYGAGLLLTLTLLPAWMLFDQIETFLTFIIVANWLSRLGAVMAFAATAVTAATLIWAIATRLLRRR